MPEVIVALALTALIALAAWRAGSLVLRIAGGVLVLAGLIGAATTSAAGLFIAAVGALVWLAGHWLYAARHHAWASPLAHRLFKQTPLRQFDPTRGWAIPTAPAQPRARRPRRRA